MLVTGSGDSKLEMTVKSFDPALTVTRAGCAVQVLDEGGAGVDADREGLALGVIEKPLADSRQELDIIRLAVGDQDVGNGVPVEVANHRRDRPRPARVQPRARREGDRTPFCDWLSRIDTWLEPSSAITRSGKPPGMRSATVIPTGLVPTK